MPYIYQQYNVRDYHAGTRYSGISCMIYPLVQALNENHRLPKYIFMLPDKDILTTLHSHNINAALVMSSTVHYLIKQIDQLLERRRQDLEAKKPGALMKQDTVIIWVRMLKRPESIKHGNSLI